MNASKPTPLGLAKSFGFGDRLGLATPGHLSASNKYDFAPIFAQQSIREMVRTQRTPEEVLQAAQTGLDSAGYTKRWGADADHLKTPEDVGRTAAAGFCFFTIDPSEFVRDDADTIPATQLPSEVIQLTANGFLPSQWDSPYLRKEFDVHCGEPLRFDDETLLRAAIKYARAISHAAIMAEAIEKAMPQRPFEIEISVDETESPTSPLEHLFVGLELKRRAVPNLVSLAPHFVGDFEKGIDYRGDLKRFEQSLRHHVAIAKFCGPYKISVHSGSDKFSAYPTIGRVCGDLLHVKTAGTTYLEALRVVARTAPSDFAEIAAFCRGRFDVDRKSYHISSTTAEIEALPRFSSRAEEGIYLDERVGRQLLHVTFGSVLTIGQNRQGKRFKEIILEALNRGTDLHQEFLDQHFSKHLSLLNKG